jgi:hypothetical protein
MSTLDDRGESGPKLACPERGSRLYPTLILALRDMRRANGRDATTGEGAGNESWIGLALGMIVLDTLSGSDEGVWARWLRLLSDHGLTHDDAAIAYQLRCSLLHGYGLPK